MPSFPYSVANPADYLPGTTISQTGALSGGLNARRTEPLISLRGGEVSRVTFAGGAVLDTYRLWTVQGAPASAGFLTGAGIREGFGPFAQATSDKIATPSLHFPGDFSAAFLVRVPPVGAALGVLWQDGVWNSNGYLLEMSATSVPFFQSGASVNVQIQGANPAPAAGTLALICCGAAGSTVYVKTNLNAIVSGAAVAYVNPTTGSALGNVAVGNNAPLLGEVYEAWFSTQPASDALFTAIATEVKTKLGITAW